MSEEKDLYELFYDAFSSSRMPKTGHSIFMVNQSEIERAPLCPHHHKKAIAREPFDELWCTRWYCIDCIAYALYPANQTVVDDNSRSEK